MRFYVVELQEYWDGTGAHLVHKVEDADADTAKELAESKWHEVMAYAAKSTIKKHSAIILTEEAFPMDRKCYIHKEPAAVPVAE